MNARVFPILVLLVLLWVTGHGAETEHGFRLTKIERSYVTIEFVLPKQELLSHVASCQWNPETEDCPLNLREGGQLARAHLEATRENVSNLRLRNASVRYIDVPELTSGVAVRKWHKVWFASFDFSGETPTSPSFGWPELTVVMLLDKTIVNTVVTSGQLTCPIVQK